MDMKTRDEQIREALEEAFSDGVSATEGGSAHAYEHAVARFKASIPATLALLDQAQPVADGARELAEKLADCAYGKMGYAPTWDTYRAAALITQALRDEREKAAERICEVARPFCTTAEISMLKNAAIMGGEGK